MKKKEMEVLMMAIHMRRAFGREHLAECRRREAEAEARGNLIFKAYYMGAAETEREYLAEMDRWLEGMAASRMEDMEWKSGR